MVPDIVDGNSAMEFHWKPIVSEYLLRIIRYACRMSREQEANSIASEPGLIIISSKQFLVDGEDNTVWSKRSQKLLPLPEGTDEDNIIYSSDSGCYSFEASSLGSTLTSKDALVPELEKQLTAIFSALVLEGH
ncbi:mediator of RNA polymerase II transcription subunit 25-like isoform X1 [Senna tora]|uniref:Mediator of RNA polymerase II transcription subunit 25-like isoform X1 n=1 Tax=Senna tora TaxID=362788 RepID=A0A834WK47_9FABA|nr:mediator of RNA polymerase II transcription subunit 25-like isoform X1 [Senna tora]